MRRFPAALLVALLFCSVQVAWAQDDHSEADSGRTIAAGLESLSVDGWSKSAVAWEPDVVDPIAATFDARGRMWVVEMRDYPFLPADDTPAGQIVVFDQPSDSDTGPVYQRRTVFASEINMPTGIAIAGDGVLCTHAGKLTYFEDTDGDLIADVSEDWIEGFSEGNEQLRANHPTLGLDGWWYIASGLRGGKVAVVKPATTDGPAIAPGTKQQKPELLDAIDMGTLDLRFHAPSGRLELVTGASQFGLSFDALGNRFSCSNRNPAIQFVVEQDESLDNLFDGIWPTTVDRLPSGSNSQVFPRVQAWTTSNLHSGQYTAACGLHLRSHGLGDDYSSNAFVCEPTGSLVSRSIISWDGRSGRLGLEGRSLASEQTGDWLTSDDEWFRPVNVANAPGGGVIVVDMHRAVIEHPHWVPEELRDRPDQRDGSSHGRIYCFEPTNQSNFLRSRLRELAAQPMHALDSAELADCLCRQDEWSRVNAAKIFVHRWSLDPPKPEGFTDLQRLALDSDAHLQGRLIAIRLLGHWAPPSIAKSIYDSLNAEPALRAVLLRNLSGKHAWVRQLLLSKGGESSWAETQATREETLLAILRTNRTLDTDAVGAVDLDDQECKALVEYYRSSPESLASAELELFALGGLLRNRPAELLGLMLDGAESRIGSGAEMSRYSLAARSLTQACRRRNDLQSLAPELVRRFENDLAEFRRAIELGQDANLAIQFTTSMLQAMVDARVQLPGRVFEQLDALARSKALTPANARRVVDLLRISESEASRDVIRGFLGQDGRLGAAAWRAYSEHVSDAEFVATASERLPSADAALGDTLAELLVANPAREKRTAQMLIEGNMDGRLLGGARVFGLSRRSSGDSKKRLREILEGLRNPDREKLIKRYAASLDKSSSAAKGKKHFGKHCANCHRVGDIGVSIGPEISDTRTKKPIELLTAILNPNLAVDNRYFETHILVENGEALAGLIEAESGDSIVIRTKENDRVVVRREEIVVKRTGRVSLMPEGFENNISPGEMSELISFLKNWRYLDGRIPIRPNRN